MRKRTVGGLLALALLSSGCENFLAGFAAGSTVRVVSRGSVGLQRAADPAMAEAAIPGSLSTLEALLVIKPDSEPLHETMARSYASYGFGFMEDHMEAAQAADDEPHVEYYRARSTAAYLRARQLSFEMLSIWEPDDGGVEGAIHRGLDAWRRYLAQFDQQSEGGIMFWGAYSWARYIGLHRDDPNALADLPYVVAMADRAKALDHTYNGFAPHGLVGGLASAAPAAMGGRPDIGRQEFDAAIAATQRHNLMYLVMEARIVAVPLQDRALFRSLLQEVINAGDVDADLRLNNVLAKRRAFRYLAQIDELFGPDESAAAAPGG
jgi:hypothetical protein